MLKRFLHLFITYTFLFCFLITKFGQLLSPSLSFSLSLSLFMIIPWSSSMKGSARNLHVNRIYMYIYIYIDIYINIHIYIYRHHCISNAISLSFLSLSLDLSQGIRTVEDPNVSSCLRAVEIFSQFCRSHYHWVAERS
jgi:hypothetical protein